MTMTFHPAARARVAPGSGVLSQRAERIARKTARRGRDSARRIKENRTGGSQ